MAADVTSIVRIMEAYQQEAEGKRRDLFTRNLLGEGGGSAADFADVSSSKELDLDFKIPSGWERRLDLLSGKTYLHKMDSGRSLPGLHDLNLPPPPTSANTVAAALPEDSSILDLKLAGGGGGGGAGGRGGEYLSVCTLEKVKSALERAGRGSDEEQRRRVAAAAAASSSSPASPSSSTTSSSMKRRAAVADDDDGRSDSTGGMMAAACPSCLLYVLISKANPRCPGCDSHVPVPFLQKKLKFDLNSS